MSEVNSALVAMVNAAVEAEREICAQIAERRVSEGVPSFAGSLAGPDYVCGMIDTAEAIARAIRARGGDNG